MDNLAVKMEAVIPFIQDFPDESYTENTLKVMEQLRSQNNKISFDFDNPSDQIKVMVSSNPSLHTGFCERWRTPRTFMEWNRWFVLLSTVVTVDVSPHARECKQYIGDRETGKVVTLPIETHLDVVETIFEQRIHDLLLCISIAIPGSVRTELGAVFVDGKFHGELPRFEAIFLWQ